MRILKRFLTVWVCLALIASFCMGFVCIATQNNAGGHSSITAISKQDRQWIYDHFGECDSIECLLLCVEDYAVRNFRYDKSKIPLFQHFDFRDLIDSKKGLCFDFAAWVKTCCLVWSERSNVELKVYVVDVEYDFFKPRHSYNVIQLPDGRNFYIDVTNSINEVQVKNNFAPGYEVFYENIEDYAAKYGEKVLFLR